MSKIVELQKNIKFNGGGHLNHEFFWDSLCAPKDSARSDKDSQLRKYLAKTWGTTENFIERFNMHTLAI